MPSGFVNVFSESEPDFIESGKSNLIKNLLAKGPSPNELDISFCISNISSEPALRLAENGPSFTFW